jgi:hypothetical protein
VAPKPCSETRCEIAAFVDRVTSACGRDAIVAPSRKFLSALITDVSNFALACRVTLLLRIALTEKPRGDSATVVATICNTPTETS